MKIAFGAKVDPLCVQLGVSAAKVEQEQKDADAIVRLAVRGLLTEMEVRRARERLLRQLGEALCETRRAAKRGGGTR